MVRADGHAHGDRRTQWKQLAPALGMILGSGLVILGFAVLDGDVDRMGLALVIGAAVGLLLGLVTRGLWR